MKSLQKAWLEYTKGVESVIHRIFYGQIKSTLKCNYCRTLSGDKKKFTMSLQIF